MKNVIPFTEKAKTAKLPESSHAYKIMERLNNGEKFDNSWKENTIFDEVFYPEGYRFGQIRVSGFLFCFYNYFKKYLVKIQHIGWLEVYAPNKTFIRKFSCSPSHIIKIIEPED